jgi:tRNA(fMet)-specific endonuclease VapC
MIYFDTVTYSALANNEKGIVKFLHDKHGIAMPLNVIAELRYGFLKGSKREENEANLQRFLAQPQIEMVFPTIETTHLYAELQLHCIKKAKILSHNDIWIAALAKENNGQLITYDKDFEALKDIFGDQLTILAYDN